MYQPDIFLSIILAEILQADRLNPTGYKKHIKVSVFTLDKSQAAVQPNQSSQCLCIVSLESTQIQNYKRTEILNCESWSKFFILIFFLVGGGSYNLWSKLWKLVKIVKFGQNCCCWGGKQHLVKVVKFGQNCAKLPLMRLVLKLWCLVKIVKFCKKRCIFWFVCLFIYFFLFGWGTTFGQNCPWWGWCWNCEVLSKLWKLALL